jgi:hypothetical protein
VREKDLLEVDISDSMSIHSLTEPYIEYLDHRIVAGNTCANNGIVYKATLRVEGALQWYSTSSVVVSKQIFLSTAGRLHRSPALVSQHPTPKQSEPY